MSRDVIHDRFITSNLQSMVFDLQEKLDEVPMRNVISSPLGSRDICWHSIRNTRMAVFLPQSQLIEKEILFVKALKGWNCKFLN